VFVADSFWRWDMDKDREMEEGRGLAEMETEMETEMQPDHQPQPQNVPTCIPTTSSTRCVSFIQYGSPYGRRISEP
jgi:hypothetical protein